MSPERWSPLEEALKSPLPRLKRQLEEEYEEVPEEKIDESAKQALYEFAQARVREFVPIMAWRRARERLRQAS
jgi:hypothetical protein